jgi:hypothetical protein
MCYPGVAVHSERLQVPGTLFSDIWPSRWPDLHIETTLNILQLHQRLLSPAILPPSFRLARYFIALSGCP